MSYFGTDPELLRLARLAAVRGKAPPQVAPPPGLPQMVPPGAPPVPTQGVPGGDPVGGVQQPDGGVNPNAAKAADMYEQAMRMIHAPVDPSQHVAEQGRRGERSGRNLVLALAAQQAGMPDIGAHFLKQAAANRGPLQVGNAGFVSEDGQFIADAAAENQRKGQILLAQAQRYEALAQRAQSAEDQRNARIAAQAAREQALELQRQNAMFQRQMAMQAAQDRQANQEFRQQQAFERENQRLGKMENVARIGERYAGNALRAIDEALKITSGQTTGAVGAVMRRIPGTQARNLDAALNTIKANVGFDALREMRSASETGGALGQVSNIENILLQSVRAALDQTQDVNAFRRELLSLKEQLTEVQSWARQDLEEVRQRRAMYRERGFAAGINQGSGPPQGAVRPRSAPQSAPSGGPPPGAVRPRS